MKPLYMKRSEFIKKYEYPKSVLYRISSKGIDGNLRYEVTDTACKNYLKFIEELKNDGTMLACAKIKSRKWSQPHDIRRKIIMMDDLYKNNLTYTQLGEKYERSNARAGVIVSDAEAFMESDDDILSKIFG